MPTSAKVQGGKTRNLSLELLGHFQPRSEQEKLQKNFSSGGFYKSGRQMDKRCAHTPMGCQSISNSFCWRRENQDGVNPWGRSSDTGCVTPKGLRAPGDPARSPPSTFQQVALRASSTSKCVSAVKQEGKSRFHKHPPHEHLCGKAQHPYNKPGRLCTLSRYKPQMTRIN